MKYAAAAQRAWVVSRPAWIPLDRVTKLKLAYDEAAEITRLAGLSGAQPLMQ
jgi:hypothetical protein